MEFWGMKLGRGFVEGVLGINVFSRIGGYSGPVQIIHGAEDPIVPAAYSQKAAALYRNARVKVLEGEGHGFTSDGCKKVTRMTEKFLMDRLQESAELLLTVEVKCGEAVYVEGDRMDICMIPFSGRAEGPYFTGQILGEGVDVQRIPRMGDKKLSARYLLEGEDHTGRKCHVFIENEGIQGETYFPLIVTDSKALSEWNREWLWDTVEEIEGGVRVRIYRSKRAKQI